MTTIKTHTLQWDFRLGPPKLVFSADKCMQIPENIRKCVAFIGCKRKTSIDDVGTCFFLQHPIENLAGTFAIYAVTARHVIERISALSSDGQTYFRVNTTSSGPVHVPLDLSAWHFHEDSRIDVAVSPIGGDFSGLDLLTIPTSGFVNDLILQANEVGPGDDLFFPGLFTGHKGTTANIPIMRCGTIAAMPGDRIETKWGNVRGYLIEARSIGGLSGSPVFLHFGAVRYSGGKLGYNPEGTPHILFLGLIHGHYGVIDLTDTRDEGDVTTDALSSRSINQGIAIVIPADDILAILNSQVFIELRAALR